MAKLKAVLFAIKNWRKLLTIALITLGFMIGAMMFLVITPMGMIASVFSFGGEEEEQLRPHYERVGHETGVYWPDVVIYDAIRTDNTFEGVTSGTISNSAKKFYYEEEDCTIIEIENEEGEVEEKEECETITYYYTLEEVLQWEGFNQEQIAYALELANHSYLFFESDVSFPNPGDFKGIFRWPVPSLHGITSYFGERLDPITGKLAMHYGIDISGENALGQLVVAAGDGTVYQIREEETGCGKWIRISHDEGFQSRYCHLYEILVKPGQQVNAGDVIGQVGSTGDSTGPHLHFELKKDGTIVNPLPFIRGGN